MTRHVLSLEPEWRRALGQSAGWPFGKATCCQPTATERTRMRMHADLSASSPSYSQQIPNSIDYPPQKISAKVSQASRKACCFKRSICCCFAEKASFASFALTEKGLESQNGAIDEKRNGTNWPVLLSDASISLEASTHLPIWRETPSYSSTVTSLRTKTVGWNHIVFIICRYVSIIWSCFFLVLSNVSWTNISSPERLWLQLFQLQLPHLKLYRLTEGSRVPTRNVWRFRRDRESLLCPPWCIPILPQVLFFSKKDLGEVGFFDIKERIPSLDANGWGHVDCKIKAACHFHSSHWALKCSSRQAIRHRTIFVGSPLRILQEAKQANIPPFSEQHQTRLLVYVHNVETPNCF